MSSSTPPSRLGTPGLGSPADPETPGEFDAEIQAEPGDTVRAKWMLDGCEDLEQVADRLEGLAVRFRQMHAAGWSLSAPIDDDWGYLRDPTGRDMSEEDEEYAREEAYYDELLDGPIPLDDDVDPKEQNELVEHDATADPDALDPDAPDPAAAESSRTVPRSPASLIPPPQ